MSNFQHSIEQEEDEKQTNHKVCGHQMPSQVCKTEIFSGTEEQARDLSQIWHFSFIGCTVKARGRSDAHLGLCLVHSFQYIGT